VLRRWETETGKLLGLMPVPGVKNLATVQAASMLAFSPDGKTLAVGRSADPPLELWSCEAGAAPRRFECLPPLSHCQVVTFAPDGRFLAMAAGANQVGVWGVASGRQLRSFPIVSASLGGLALSSGGRLLAHGGGSPALHLWEVADNRAIHPEDEAEQGIQHTLLLRDRKTLVAVDGHGYLRAHDTTTGKLLGRTTERVSGAMGLTLTADGLGAQGCLTNGQRLTWQPGGPARLDPPPGSIAFSQGTALSPDGKTYVVILPQTVRRFDLVNGGDLPAWPGTQSPAISAFFTPCGQWLLAAGTNGDLQCWDAATGRVIKTGQRLLMRRPGLSPDGHTLAISSAREVRLVEVGGWQERARIVTPGIGFIHSEALSPDGELLVCGNSQGDLHVFEVSTGKALGRLIGHRGPARALQFSPDGSLLISGSDDTTILLWDVARLRPAPAPLARLSAEELVRLCDDLGSGDAAKAYRAVRALAGAADFVGPLGKRLALAGEPPAKRIPKLIAQLDDDDFDLREKAAQELMLYGREAEEALKEALKGQSAQVKRSAGELLGQLKDGLPPRQLLEFRALEVLERAGTAEARKLLADLAAGEADAWLTRQARLALQRVGQR
jgi:WD40 repeat protein